MTATCAIDGCEKSPRARGLCGAHYESDRRAGRIAPGRNAKACLVAGCPERVVGHGYCDVHYRRWKRNGTPDKQPVHTVDERFWSFVNKAGPVSERRPDLGPCWVWTGGGWPSGYGSFRVNGVKVGAHRYAYERLVGPIPEGLVVDHLCFNRSCVRPAHLEVVTFRENILRGDNTAAQFARRSNCLRGHCFDPPNGYITSQGARGCRACDRIRSARKRSRAKQAE